MLNYYAHKIHHRFSNKSLKNQIADISGLSSKTIGKSVNVLNGRSLNKIREAFMQIDDSRPSKPRFLVNYASIVSISHASEANYPKTIEFARLIDDISAQLWVIREENNFLLFKETLIEWSERNPEYLSLQHGRQTRSTNPEMIIKINSASDWDEIDEPINFLAINILYSFLALWDLEFYANSFSSFEPRSIFALVLPRLDPIAGNPEIEKSIPKRRDMFWYPVRRLIDLSYYLAGYSISGRWPQSTPSIGEVAIIVDRERSTLINWRDGTKNFSESDFNNIWKKFSEQIINTRPIKPTDPPTPLFIATLFWQELFVSVNTSNMSRTLYLKDNDYLLWWGFHFDELKTKGVVFGSTPWPTCIIK